MATQKECSICRTVIVKTKKFSKNIWENKKFCSNKCKSVSRRKHVEGETETRFYRKWESMNGRCKDKENGNYGKRGITVCDEWRDYRIFKKDMYDSFVKLGGLEKNPHVVTLDRIDNDKGYSKENCRWADMKTQALNKRNTKFFEFNGEKNTLANWAIKLNIKRSTLAQRFYVLKWPIEKVLTK